MNIHGLPGRNIPCDLYMEFINRAAKDSLHGLGSNITDNAVGKSIGETTKTVNQFDKDKEPSGRHSKRSKKKDMDTIVKQLHQVTSVFSIRKGRSHRYFKTLKAIACELYLQMTSKLGWILSLLGMMSKFRSHVMYNYYTCK